MESLVGLKIQDYKMRLAKLLAVSSKTQKAPMLYTDFTLKDIEEKKRELIPAAYEDAKKEDRSFSYRCK
jgi:hypothetical protein